MKNLKTNVKSLATEAAKFFMNKKIRMAFFAFLFVLSLIQTAAPAFAAATIESIANSIRNGLGQVYQLLILILSPVAVVALAFILFNIVWGGEKGMERAKSAGIHLGIGVALVLLSPLIISTVYGWFAPGGKVDDYGIFSDVPTGDSSSSTPAP